MEELWGSCGELMSAICLVPAPGHRHVTVPALPLWHIVCPMAKLLRIVNLGTPHVSRVAIWQHLIMHTAALVLPAGPANVRPRAAHCICSTTARIEGHEHCDCVAVSLLSNLVCRETTDCIQAQELLTECPAPQPSSSP